MSCVKPEELGGKKMLNDVEERMARYSSYLNINILNRRVPNIETVRTTLFLAELGLLVCFIFSCWSLTLSPLHLRDNKYNYAVWKTCTLTKSV